MDTKDNIQTYATISDFYEALGIPLEQEAEFTVHATDRLHEYYPQISPLFRTNYYSLVIIREGQGKYILDDQEYRTEPLTIYFTNPGHIKGFQITRPYFGYIVTFSEAFLKRQVHPEIFDEFPFLIAETVPPHQLSEESFEPFAQLCAQMLQEYHGRSPYKYRILSNLLTIFLLRIKERFWDSYDPQVEGRSTSPIVTTFKLNLEAHMRDLAAGTAEQLLQVQDFARLQGLHPNYFSTVIKRKTGKTVNRWISEKLAAEAQALLAQSSLSIKEISYRLAFQEPTHFSRFFKKQTGQTPSHFRQQHQT